MASKIKLRECSFVHASEVFKGLPKAWDAFSLSDPPFSWGDNNRTLVDADSMRRHLEDADPIDGKAHGQINRALARLEKLGQTYVDLEN